MIDWLTDAWAGIVLCAAIAFPVLYFPHWHLALRLLAAVASILLFGALVDAAMNHKFYYLGPENLLAEGLGIVVASAVSLPLRRWRRHRPG